MRLPLTGIFLLAPLPAIAAAQWTWISIPTVAELRGLSVVDSRVVWASGTQGTALRSADGGRTWSVDTVPGAATLDLRSVQAISDGAAFVASAGEAEKGLAKIFTTGDAGRHWRLAWSTTTKGIFLDAIAFWDARHGLALSDPIDDRFYVLRTNDGGRTWTRVPPENLPRHLPGEASFAASGSVLAVAGAADVWIATGGNTARVLHSSDRGVTWSFTDVPIHSAGPAAGIFSLAFFDTKRGIAVGGDYTQPQLTASTVAITSDGGRSWRRAASPPAAYLSGVAFAGRATDVVAVGLAGTYVSRDGGDSWSRTDTVALNAVRALGRGAIAVGPRGRIARMDSLP